MKSRFISLFSMLLVLCMNWPSADAGTWHTYNKFSGAVLNVADTPDYVYYFSNNSLYRFDKSSNTTLALSKDNVLSDASLVTKMAYDPSRDLVVVVYSNSNIDIILSDGSTVNVPVIYGATITGNKTVNDVTFSGNRIYLATAYGMVVLEQQGNLFAVVENRIYDLNISSVAHVGNYRIFSRASSLYYAVESNTLENLNMYKTASGVAKSALLTPIDDTHFFAAESGALKRVTMTVAGDGTVTFTPEVIAEVTVDNVQRTPTGWLASCKSSNCYYTTDALGGNASRHDITGEVVSSNPMGDGTIWAVGPEGLHRVGNSTYYKPSAITYAGPSYWLSYNPHNGKTYVKTTATNYFFPTNTFTFINSLDEDGWHDVTPSSVKGVYSQWMIFDPLVPDTYYLAGWTSGLYKIVNDEVALIYNASNSPMGKRSGAMHPINAMDKANNMWVCQGYEKPDGGSVMMLPREKLLAQTCSKSDWLVYNTPDVYSENTKRASITITPHTDIKAYTDGEYQPNLIVWRGDANNLNQETASVVHLTDKMGNNVGNITYTHALVADQNDNIWVGATEGMFYFDPAELLDDPENFRVTRPLIEDGQPLLNGIQVNCIAVAPDNTKWIGTNSNGLFKVSADGTHVLHHFTTLNSSLTTNCIYQLCCNPTRKSVFMTTPIGVLEYVDDDDAEATSDYSHVSATPATVWPDYTGAVTIDGLANGSNVVIRNSAGNIVARLKAKGESVKWDACDNMGERLPTGVYTIQAATGNATKAPIAARINIVK